MTFNECCAQQWANCCGVWELGPWTYWTTDFVDSEEGELEEDITPLVIAKAAEEVFKKEVKSKKGIHVCYTTLTTRQTWSKEIIETLKKLGWVEQHKTKSNHGNYKIVTLRWLRNKRNALQSV